MFANLWNIEFGRYIDNNYLNFFTGASLPVSWYRYLEVRGDSGCSWNPVDTVIAGRCLCQGEVLLVQVQALPEGHVTDDQESSAICVSGVWVLSTRTADVRKEERIYNLQLRGHDILFYT